MNRCKDCRFARKRYWIFGEMMCRSKDVTHGESISCSEARMGFIFSFDVAENCHVRRCPIWEER